MVANVSAFTQLLKIGKAKGPVKLIKRMKTAHSFLQSVSNQFHVIILSLPMYQLQCTTEFVPNALKQLFFVLIVFITAESMSCIHIKQ